ncbi:winged helix-turn-helix transcriptional regulator [Dyadobacter fanqingshengii]|uniref:Helix-turn-helix transcriptional regulator n=1 Tax=Dyadobacter fanqingshengii TaxID=2906443 RepID=A0A9X1P9Y3_9BACT|nr:helix-turn-helix domain-containing protein [Dyadobacter fanqingshengii]MCF0040394.1 helix-turn-helix transcriptional regulator [Dyadobacter fanqingshengii]USJ37864.1 helix-turn-helix transcriptional regulator [Dyadobacter fanqingshengii]
MKTIERRSTCPINYSVEIFGDKWMLLLLRDIMFNGKNSFLEFRASDEKISSAVLTEKLNLLLDEGIVSKVTSPKNASKFLYLITDKGIELVPVMVEILTWGSRYNPDGGQKTWLDRIKQNKKKAIAELQDELRSQLHSHGLS